MAVDTKKFAQMSSKKLREILPTLNEEEAVAVENLLTERNKYLKPAKTIQEYKDRFAALYSELISDFKLEKASISISWETEYKDGERIIKPHVLIAF